LTIRSRHESYYKESTKKVQRDVVVLELQQDEVQWLRDILALVSVMHDDSDKLYEKLNELSGSNENEEERGFSGFIDYDEPE